MRSLLGLTIDGLNLGAATITISQQVLDLDEGPSIEPYTKNDEPRTLPLTARVVTLLEVRLTQLLAEHAVDWADHGLIFPSERGTPMSERNLDRHFKAACVKAKIRLRDTGQKRADGTPIFTSDLKFHHLRHTCLSWLGDAGASDKILKAIAGHADSDVTDRYVHLSLEAMREVIERMEAAKLSDDTGDGTAAHEAGDEG
jgi:integrase